MPAHPASTLYCVLGSFLSFFRGAKAKSHFCENTGDLHDKGECSMNGKRVPVLTRSETSAVNPEDILYAESRLRLILLCTIRRQYRYYGKLDDLMRRLNSSFYRCHVSWIINLDHVVSVRNCAIHMSDGKIILLGRNKFQAARKRYIEYLCGDDEQSE
jgi:DNA-binding LytR/AlgR family response regulator